jgi:NAD+ synthase (glutamine-hydrolysing)
MINIRLVQLDYHIGNFAENVGRIIHAIESARADGVDLVVFAELAVCGYPPRDFLEFKGFVDECEAGLQRIAQACRGITAIVGAPERNNGQGKSLFNAAHVLRDGGTVATVRKALLPTYDIFDEYRYFEPGRQFATVEVKGVRVALTVCEDLWNIVDPLYVTHPMDELMAFGPQLMVNIAASPFDAGHREERIKVLSANCRRYSLPLLYVNHVGAQTELIFDGGSMALDAQGNVLHELAYFEEDTATFRITAYGLKEDVWFRQRPSETIARVHDALVLGIRDYFRKLGLKQAVLGLSGGIDSAVTLVLAARALGPENVRTLLMPSMYSSKGSIDDSVELSLNLGTAYDIVPIEGLFHSFSDALTPLFAGRGPDLTEENLQARIRGVLLMAVSNKMGHILLNTSNKSECAVGYSTLYGDMNGGLAVIGDVYKTDIYRLAEFMNRDHEVIPRAIIDKAPSAELRPDQRDQDSLPEYPVLDAILRLYIEGRQSPDQIIALGHDSATVLRVLRLVNTTEYKRHQTPPILRVSSKAFGQGRRMPIVAKYLG